VRVRTPVRRVAHRLTTTSCSAAYMYTFGNAGTGGTYRNNLEALEQWRIVPRMLRDATHRNLDVGAAFSLASDRADSSTPQTTLFGVKLPSPIIIAPVGVQGILHKDGELATASAAASVGVPFTLSTASTRSIEAVAKANGDGHRWYQLYWCAQSPPSRNPTMTLFLTLTLPRAARAGHARTR
jgi:isopentenyl diphosphate isomerase/L-lactate dehydrogenase-like FMN-dependent dehydrogenase